MIYIDTSVILALLLGESRQPRAGAWSEELVSSRLLEDDAMMLDVFVV